MVARTPRFISDAARERETGMSAQPQRHLRPVEEESPLFVVNPATGERKDLADFTQALEDAIAGLQRDIRGWAARFEQLKRDKEGQAKESPVWPAAVRVFDYWKRQCKHPRSQFTLDRFEMIRPFLEKYGDKRKPEPERLVEAEELCKLAVDGIALQHYEEPLKNGKTMHHTGIHLIFGEADLFEKRSNSAPAERIREVLGPQEPGQQTLDQAQDAG